MKQSEPITPGQRRRAIDRHLACRLYEARTTANISAVKAAKSIGTDHVQIHRIEKKQARIPASILLILAELYDKPLSWFFEGMEN